ncbi:MAG: cytochrome b/b6 domain-containing protein [Sphingomonadaceae bacterium]
MAARGAPLRPVRVWDLPTRLFHWTLVVLIGAMWLTGQDRNITLHTQLGAVLVGLLVFRLLWGVVGSETARFASFLKGPQKVLGYLRGRHRTRFGHNPLGGWSVAAILLVLAAQCVAGLFAHDVDGMESGPLSYLVAYETADAARIWHHRLFDVLLVLVALHISAVVYYLLGRGEDLVVPMISGRKELPEDVAPPARGSWLALGLSLLVAGLVIAWLLGGARLPALLFA